MSDHMTKTIKDQIDRGDLRAMLDAEVARRAAADPRDRSCIPAGVLDSLVQYIEQGVPQGGFLTAVLSNDLKESVARADANSTRGLVAIVVWLYTVAPDLCWGSRQKVESWIGHRGHGGLKKEGRQ